MNPTALSSAIAQGLHEVPPSIRRADEKAERENELVAKLTRERNPVKTHRDSRDNRDTAPDKGFSVPEHPGQSRDSRDNSVPCPHFELLEQRKDDRAPGVYWCDVVKDKEGNITGEAAPVWICSPLRVAAMTRDAQNGEWGRLLAFPDKDGRIHRWTCPQSLHAGNGDELRGVLLREGLTITSTPKFRQMVGDYIQRERPEVRARCVNRTGWHGDVFALPRETFGDSETEPVLFQAATLDGVELGQRGTLAGWVENVAAPCAGNSRLVLAICAGFAAPCVGLLQSEGGGVHLRGPSSCGKSTALHVAASLYGEPQRYARNWRATDNGLEGVAAIHSDLLLVLDEIGQLEPKHAGQVAYMLANGQGKSRSHRDGSPRATTTWRVLFLSAGEVGLADLVTQSGGKVRAGQEVRVIDVPADTGKHGLFEAVPDGMTPAAFADKLKAAAATHFGHALPAFLNALVANPDKARETLRALREVIAAKLTPKDAAGQVQRVADRYALIAAAGELATAWKLTGWATDEATHAAEVCFRAWLDARGTLGDGEPAAMLERVRGFLEANSEARFTAWDADTERVRTVNRAGFRKDGPDGPTFYVEGACFKNEVCAGFDYQAVARVLAAKGALVRGSDNETTRKERLPDKRSVRVYVIGPALWGDA
jgi:putative DNA primase/helicase